MTKPDPNWTTDDGTDDGACRHGQTMFCTDCFTESITPPEDPRATKLPSPLFAAILRYLRDEGCDINHNILAMTNELVTIVAASERAALRGDLPAPTDDKSDPIKALTLRFVDMLTTHEVIGQSMANYEIDYAARELAEAALYQLHGDTPWLTSEAAIGAGALRAAADELDSLVAIAVPEAPIKVKVSAWLRVRADGIVAAAVGGDQPDAAAKKLDAIRLLAEAAKVSLPHATYTGVSWHRVLEILDGGDLPKPDEATACPNCESEDKAVHGITAEASTSLWGYSEVECKHDWHDSDVALPQHLVSSRGVVGCPTRTAPTRPGAEMSDFGTEIGRLLKSTAAERDAARAEIDTLKAQRAAVLDIHTPFPTDNGSCVECDRSWPCASYRALAGPVGASLGVPEAPNPEKIQADIRHEAASEDRSLLTNAVVEVGETPAVKGDSGRMGTQDGGKK